MAWASTVNRFTDKKTGKVKAFNWHNVCRTEFDLRREHLAPTRKLAAKYRKALLNTGLIEIVLSEPGKALRVKLTAKTLGAIYRDVKAIKGDLENKPRKRNPVSMQNLIPGPKPRKNPSKSVPKLEPLKSGQKGKSSITVPEIEPLKSESAEGDNATETAGNPSITVPEIEPQAYPNSNPVKEGSKRQNSKAKRKSADRGRALGGDAEFYARDVAQWTSEASEILKANATYTFKQDKYAIGFLSLSLEKHNRALRLSDRAVDQTAIRRVVRGPGFCDVCERFAAGWDGKQDPTVSDFAKYATDGP
ncbi:MAG: hypothetical protein ACYTEQ_28135 [Planctomycetota bacterium]